ncbi:MAG: hypothetical protein DI538_09525 [Azospira oryzae]|nr:MAG: hypothetical protein DI538_09525 [Azospira oryzae]
MHHSQRDNFSAFILKAFHSLSRRFDGVPVSIFRASTIRPASARPGLECSFFNPITFIVLILF